MDEQKIWTIEVSGDRQAGKTDLLVSAAVRDAKRGRRVLFLTCHAQSMRAAFHDVQSCGAYSAVRRRHGEERVTYPSGGYVEFHRGGGRQWDVLVFDECPSLDGARKLAEAVLADSEDPRLYVGHRALG